MFDFLKKLFSGNDSSIDFQQVAKDSPINILIANLEGNITFLNASSDKTLRTLEHLLPIKVDNILGSSYDVFHKMPDHQRRLLADPKNLPHQTIIDVGEEKLDLLVTALYDTSGKFTGPMVSWSVVTQKLKLEEEGNKSNQMIDNIPTNIILADLDGNITFLNESSKKTLASLEHVLPIKSTEIVGASYDIFHKVPDHQRRLLADPKNLPHQAVIEFAGEKLDLLVTALYDKEGVYLGPMLTWSIVTAQEQAKQNVEDSKQRLESTVLGLVDSSDQTSQELNKYITSVGTATEEMISSITEISRNTGEAASMTSNTVNVTEETQKIIDELSSKSQEIGEILQVINSIASQTNLLAVNATIESARAGEAGKGFAVVANEVKELATQTANATKDISEKILAIQKEADRALNSIKSTTSSVKSINEAVVTIASSVEEQSAVTNEIGKSMSNANEKVSEVVQSIGEIKESVQTNIGLM